MDITRATLETCTQATGTVVVIDVLRSFTTAAFAFAARARAILPVSAIADAQALQARFPDALAMGALGGGWPIPDFDLSNSPAALVGRDLAGQRIIHCTAAGVQGLPAISAADLDYCADINRFDFAMLVRRHEDLLVMEPIVG